MKRCCVRAVGYNLTNCLSKKVLLFSVVALVLTPCVAGLFDSFTFSSELNSTALALEDVTSYTSPIIQVSPAVNQSFTDARVAEAYRAVADAERKGGNVSSLVYELNSAIDLVTKAEQTGNQSLRLEALSKLLRVVQEASIVGEQGQANFRSNQIWTAITFGVEGAIAVLAYVFSPRIFWTVWARLRGRWRVKPVEKR